MTYHVVDRASSNVLLVGGLPTLYGQFAKSHTPYFFATLWYIMMRGIDYKNFETLFLVWEKVISYYIVLIITIVYGPKIGDF